MNRRGSPEAIEKRRIARRFDDLLSSSRPRIFDGRTEKRRKRLLRDLECGTRANGQDLKPIEILDRVDALLSLGEPIDNIRRTIKTKIILVPTESEAELVDLIKRMDKSYHYRYECYRLLGIDVKLLHKAGVVPGVTRQTPVSTSRSGASSRSALSIDEIQSAIDQSGGNVLKAAKALGVSRSVIYGRISRGSPLSLRRDRLK